MTLARKNSHLAQAIDVDYSAVGDSLTIPSSGNVTITNSLAISSQTVSTIVGFDENQKLISLPTSTYPSFTELSYLKGVTSSLQTQLNSKSTSASPSFTGSSTFTNSGDVVPLTVTNTGTAASFVVNDATGDTSPFVIDNAGNVGIGTSSPGGKLEVNSGASAAVVIVKADSEQNSFLSIIGNGNSFLSTSLDIYQLSNNAAAIMQRANSTLAFGTNNETRVTISSGGNVGIGSSSPPMKLYVSRTNSYVGFCDDFYSTAYFGPRQVNDGYCTILYSWSTYGSGNYWQTDFNSGEVNFTQLVSGVNGGSLFRIGSAGNVTIGGTADPAIKLYVAGNLVASSGNTFAIGVSATIPSGATANCQVFRSAPFLQAASFTLGDLRHFFVGNASLGAGSAITTQTGFYVGALSSATTNIGFRSDVASASNRWNFYAAGSAPNYFAGNVGIGTTSANFRLVVANNTTDGVWAFSDGSAKTYLGFGGYANSSDGSVRLMYDRAIGVLSFNFGTRDAPSEKIRFTLSGSATFAGQIVGQAGAAISGGAVTVTSPVRITGTVAGNNRMLEFQTEGVTRWHVTPTFGAETGSNVGSDFFILRFNDAGSFIGSPLQIRRDTGRITAENGLTSQDQLIVTAGSVSACSVAPTGDPNTGLYFPAANVAAIVTDGSERVRVDASGNVGIGLATPQVKLHCFTSSDGAQAVFSGAQTANEQTILFRNAFYTNNSSAGIAAIGWIDTGASGGILTLKTTTNGGGASGTPTERMRIDASGNVGIGTTSPSEKLCVFADNNTGRTSILIDNLDQRLKMSCYYELGVGQYAEIQSMSNAETTMYDLNINRAGGNVSIGGVANNHRLSIGGPGDQYIARTINTGALILMGGSSTLSTDAGFIARGGSNGYNTAGIEIYTGGLESMRITNLGEALLPYVYNDTVGGTNRDLYIDSTGKLGYVTSIRSSKTNITPIDNISWLMSLNPVSFHYRKKDIKENYTEEVDGEKDYGLIAEEVEEIAPELCFYDMVDNEPQLRGVTYSKLITPMLKYIQQLEIRIAALEERLSNN